MKSIRVLTVAAAVLILSASAGATMISIVNSSFEDPVLSDDAWSDEAPPGWSQIGDEFVGVWNTTFYDFDPVIAPDGENVGYADNYSEGTTNGLQQILTETFEADTDYTLTAEVGNWYSANWAGYNVQLLAGGTVIAMDDNTLWPDEMTWGTSTVEYTYDSADSGLVGEQLEIRLLNLGIDMYGDGWYGGGLGYGTVAFDSIALDAGPLNAVPEPASLVLFGLGALMLARKRS